MNRFPCPDLAAVFRQLLLAAPIRLWALILAGPSVTGFLGWLVWIVWQGTWPDRLAEKRLETLGALAMILAGVVLVIVVSLAAVKLEAETKLGKLSIEADDPPPPPSPPPAA